MKTISCLLAITLSLSLPTYAVGGHGGGGGGGHGGHGGSSGGHHNDNQRSPSRHNGHWQNHSGRHNGHWNNHNWNGRYYNSWHGPYYYGGAGWWAGGLFLVGFTFYTCSILAISSTHTWVIYSGDIDSYNSWPDQQNVSIMQVDDDPDWPYRLCYNDGSCVRARPASNQ